MYITKHIFKWIPDTLATTNYEYTEVSQSHQLTVQPEISGPECQTQHLF